MVINSCTCVKVSHANWTMVGIKEKSNGVFNSMLLELVQTELLVCIKCTWAMKTRESHNIGGRKGGTVTVMCVRHFKVSKSRGKMLLECFGVPTWAVLYYRFNAGLGVARREVCKSRRDNCEV